jgi:2-desacetyl-2-hydroxyethyl bacteriochlorophyllide A dehydrogenase
MMRALWLEERTLSLRADVSVPEPPEGEALVRVLRAGICGTDLEMVRGYYPYAGIPGHEFVGLVEEGPAGLRGRRVVGEINAVCGRCPTCRAGRSSHCPSRSVLGIVNRHGAFAELLALPVENLHAVPDGIATDAAVFTEPLAAALRIRDQVEITAGDRVLVVGDGRLGQLVARVMALSGCDLAVVGRHEAKLDLLVDIGIRTLNVEAVTERSFDLAIECTGSPGGFAAALGALRPRGRLVMKSTYAGSLAVDAAAIVVDEIEIVGSRCGPIAPALELLASGKVDLTPLIHARFPLEEAIAAHAKAAEPGILKVLLDIGG